MRSTRSTFRLFSVRFSIKLTCTVLPELKGWDCHWYSSLLRWHPCCCLNPKYQKQSQDFNEEHHKSGIWKALKNIRWLICNTILKKKRKKADFEYCRGYWACLGLTANTFLKKTFRHFGPFNTSLLSALRVESNAEKQHLAPSALSSCSLPLFFFFFEGSWLKPDRQTSCRAEL